MKKGFTLIELLIVIAIIAILAGVVFVSLDPLKRFQSARDAARWTDVTAVLSALKVDQVDNGGSYITAVDSATADTNYVIGKAVTGCNTICDGVPTAQACIDLSGLNAEAGNEGYLGKIPVSPEGTKHTGASNGWDDTKTGYYLNKSPLGALTIGACDSEDLDALTASPVKVSR